MKEFLTIIGIFIALFFTYHLVWFLIFKRTFKPVLMYHRITDEEKPIDIRYQIHKGKPLNLDSMKVRPSEFESQLKYLKQKGFITPSLREDLFKIKDKAVYMTFDDGYVDNYTNAFPRLQKYDFKGIFYITAGLIENGFMPIDQNDQQVSNRLMNHEELNILNRAGMQIGSHSMTHPWLNDIGIDLNIEIVQSKLILEEKLGIKIDTFAYPGGLYDNEVLNLVKNIIKRP
ncbi:Polysaccharide deacetylase [Paracholeplasma brassicae]|uniref:Polysaccharide deacetylase n=1 Tax=Acholeplasma brassicae TaxID=61635 RepID=U4KM76_9MOLU|nr:polysaccharide deacetylase family protein [Paracholeplasma brassicae]CCV65140.1 Polysaccharide deacetylase [Paracholeplasma brassicae]